MFKEMQIRTEMPFYLSNYPRIEKKCMKQAKLYIGSIK